MPELKDVLATAGAIPTAKFGGVSNNTEIEADGTQRYNGTSTTWDDIVNSLVASRLESTAGKLQYNYDNNSITMQSGGSITNISDRIIANFQYPHGAIVDGSMHLHIHWEQIDTTSREFTLEYRIQSNGALKTEAWTQVIIDSNTGNLFTYTSGTLMQITELEQIDMTGAGLSPTVQFRVARTDAVAGDIESFFIDAHVERDGSGSRQEYIK